MRGYFGAFIQVLRFGVESKRESEEKRDEEGFKWHRVERSTACVPPTYKISYSTVCMHPTPLKILQ